MLCSTQLSLDHSSRSRSANLVLSRIQEHKSRICLIRLDPVFFDWWIFFLLQEAIFTFSSYREGSYLCICVRSLVYAWQWTLESMTRFDFHETLVTLWVRATSMGSDALFHPTSFTSFKPKQKCQFSEENSISSARLHILGNLLHFFPIYIGKVPNAIFAFWNLHAITFIPKYKHV
jgi:hypothetical protein